MLNWWIKHRWAILFGEILGMAGFFAWMYYENARFQRSIKPVESFEDYAEREWLTTPTSWTLDV